MGQSADAVCITCKKQYHLGYGGVIFRKQLQDKFPKQLHIEHEWMFYCSEYACIKGEDLYNDGCGFVEDTLFVSGFENFRYLNLSKIPPENWELVDVGEGT